MEHLPEILEVIENASCDLGAAYNILLQVYTPTATRLDFARGIKEALDLLREGLDRLREIAPGTDGGGADDGSASEPARGNPSLVGDMLAGEVQGAIEDELSRRNPSKGSRFRRMGRTRRRGA